jgi:hypothetical protein
LLGKIFNRIPSKHWEKNYTAPKYQNILGNTYQKDFKQT